MLLILEICLAIAAWRRGWRGWALLPPVLCFSAGLLLGFTMGDSSATEGILFGVGLVADLACVGVLIGMVAKPRRRGQTATHEQMRESEVIAEKAS